MNHTIQITIPKAVITSVFTSEKNQAQYVRFSSPAGEFSLSCPSSLHDFNNYLEADRQDYTFDITGRLFGGNQQSLQVQKIVQIGKAKQQQ